MPDDSNNSSIKEAPSEGIELLEPGEVDRTVCFCHNVQLVALVAAIRAGATTLHDIQADTCASTGCGGCEYEVLEALEKELARKPQV